MAIHRQKMLGWERPKICVGNEGGAKTYKDCCKSSNNTKKCSEAR